MLHLCSLILYCVWNVTKRHIKDWAELRGWRWAYQLFRAPKACTGYASFCVARLAAPSETQLFSGISINWWEAVFLSTTTLRIMDADLLSTKALFVTLERIIVKVMQCLMDACRVELIALLHYWFSQNTNCKDKIKQLKVKLMGAWRM